MGALAELDFSMTWSGTQCQLRDDVGRQIPVQVQHGCPMVSLADGQQILQWLEGFQVHQRRKLAMVRSFMQNPGEIDPAKLDLEMALTIKLKRLFPDLPEEILGKLVPHLDAMNSEQFGSLVPWNRHKRRRLQRARNVVLHVFSGDNPQFWERNLSTSTTEVLCVDLQGGGIKANLLDKHVYAFLLTVAASGRLRILLGGPLCRTVSALRSQDDGGPGELRSEEWPYGLPDLSMADAEKVQNDSILFFRYLSLYVVAEEVRLPQDPKTEFILEQPRDPEEYRSQDDLQQRRYMSMFRTPEWKNFQAAYQFYKVVFDQGPMGHERLKQAMMVAIRQRLQVMDLEWAARHPQSAAVTPKGRHASLPALNEGQKQPDEHFSVPSLNSGHSSVQSPIPDELMQTRNDSEPASLQPLGPDTVPSHERTAEVQASNVPTSSHERVPVQSQRQVKALGAVALEEWRRHFLNDHMPARRDCSHCVRAQARSKPHRRIQHPDSYTLSLDLSGKLSHGDDQVASGCRYLLVSTGKSLISVPGQNDPEQDQLLPGLDDELSEAEVEPDEGEGIFPEEDDVIEDEGEEGAESPATKRAKSMNATWLKMVEEASDVAVRQLTFVQPVKSRNVKHLLPALARVYASLRALGLPVYRVHSDRAREFCSAEVQPWATDRSILTTMTSGSSFKANGRVEGEMNVIKKSIRVLISSGAAKLTQWPLAARHIGERRLRRQLHQLGWPVGRLLRFGATAYALRKSWQERYTPWREVREEVTILGPDIFSSLTSIGYFVQSKATGRCFFTDDVVVPAQPLPNVEEQVIYLPERPERVPCHRHRKKEGVPALSMLDIEGERMIVTRHPEMFETAPGAPHDSSSDSCGWTLETTASTDSSPRIPNYAEEDWWLGGGNVEGAPNTQAGGSYLGAPTMYPAAMRRMQVNLGEYIGEELQRLDATEKEQAWWLEAVSESIHLKQMVEQQLQEAEEKEVNQMHQSLEQEFLVTKTVSNQEVWNNLEAWSPSIHKEFNQLVHTKKAVRQVTKDQLRQMASRLSVGIETLPGKMVHVRKPGGVYKSRAVICGNYADDTNDTRTMAPAPMPGEKMANK
eukprot:s1206_g30.t1